MSIYRLKGASASVANIVHDLGESTTIGRADDCDLRIDDDGCAPRHCVIERGDDGALVLRHLAREPGFETRVNGETVQVAALGRGDEIRIGPARWMVQAPGLRPDRVLTDDAVRTPRSHLPWLIPVALLSAAALAWQQGWLPF